MTLNQRNTTLRTLISVHGAAVILVVVWLVWQSPEISTEHAGALTAATATTVIGMIYGVLFLRLFRRSRSIPIFFMVVFFVLTMLDALKWTQPAFAQSITPYLGVLVSRVIMFGYVGGALAIFASGLYADAPRLKWPGISLVMGGLLSGMLVWVVPVDAAVLPPNLVYPAGVPAPVNTLTAILFFLGVLNYSEQAIVRQDLRKGGIVLAVLVVVVGRVLLYQRTDLLSIVLGGVLFISGAAVYGFVNYRDYLVS